MPNLPRTTTRVKGHIRPTEVSYSRIKFLTEETRFSILFDMSFSRLELPFKARNFQANHKFILTGLILIKLTMEAESSQTGAINGRKKYLEFIGISKVGIAISTTSHEEKIVGRN